MGVPFWTEGFDNYLNYNDLYSTFGLIQWKGQVDINFGPGRYGGQALYNPTGNVTPTTVIYATYMILTNSYNSFYMGFSYNFLGTGASAGTPGFLFRDTVTGATQFYVQFSSTTAQITVTNGIGTTLWVSANGLYPTSSWFFVEIGFTIGTSGTLVIKINGAQVYSGSNLVLQNGSSNTFNMINLLINNLIISTVLIDDMYFSSTGFVEEGRELYLVPTGNSSVQWTPLSGANYTNVDSVLSQTSTYNYSSTAGNVDTFVMQPLPYNTIIISVRSCYFAEKDDTTLRQIAGIMYSGSTVNVGTTYTLNMSNFQYYGDLYATDPNTSAAWTVSGLTASTWGYKEIA